MDVAIIQCLKGSGQEFKKEKKKRFAVYRLRSVTYMSIYMKVWM